MANLYVTEYSTTAYGMPGKPADLALEPAVAEQKVAFTSATASAAFNSATRFVRLLADADCHVAFGAAPTATADSQKLVADMEYWRAVIDGQKVSAYDGTT